MIMTKRGFQSLKTKALKELYRIGCCYEHGDGVDKDEVEAVKWYRMAADQDFVSAIFCPQQMLCPWNRCEAKRCDSD